MSELWERYAALMDYASGYAVPTVDEDALLYRVQQLRQKSRYKKQAAVPSMMPTPEKEWAPEKKKFMETATKFPLPPSIPKPLVEATLGKGYDLFKRITSGEVSKDRKRKQVGEQIGQLLEQSERRSGRSETMRGIKIADAYPEHADLFPEGSTYGDMGDFASMARERGRLDATETINFMSGPGSAMLGQTLIDKGVDPKIALVVELAAGILEPIPLIGKAGKAMTAGEGVGRLGARAPGAITPGPGMGKALGPKYWESGQTLKAGAEVVEPAYDVMASVERAVNTALAQKGIRLTPFALDEARRITTELAEASDAAGRLIKKPGEGPPGGPVLPPGGEKASLGPVIRPGETQPGGPIVKPGVELGKPAVEPERVVPSEVGEARIQRGLDVGGGRARQAAERQRLEAQAAAYKKQHGLERTRKARMARPARREMTMTEKQLDGLIAERAEARVSGIAAKKETVKVAAEQKAAAEVAEKVQFKQEFESSRKSLVQEEGVFVSKLPKKGEKFRARDLKVQAKPLRDRVEAFVEGKGSRGERGAMAEFQLNQLPKIRKQIKKSGLNPDDYFPKSWLVKHIKKAGGRHTPDKFHDGLHQYVAKTRLYFAKGVHYEGKMPLELAGPLEGTGLLKQIPTYTKGKGMSPQEMIEDLRAQGYRLPEDANEYDLYAMIVEDYLHFKKTGRSRHHSSLSQDAVDDDIAEAMRVYEKMERETALEAGAVRGTEQLDRWINLSKGEITDPKMIDELRPAMEGLMAEQERIATRLADPKVSSEEAAILKARNKKVDKTLTRMEDAAEVDTDFAFKLEEEKPTVEGFRQFQGEKPIETKGEVPPPTKPGGLKPERRAVQREAETAWSKAAREEHRKANATERLDAESKRLHDLTDPTPSLFDEKGIVAADLVMPAAMQRGAAKLREMFDVLYLGGVRSLDSSLERLGKSKAFDESVRLRMRKFRERLHSYENYVETNSMSEITKFKNTIKNLTDDEWLELVEILNKKGGKAFGTIESPKLRFAAQRVRSILDRVADEGEPSGVLIGRRDAYFPHRFTKEQLSSTEFIKSLAKHSNISEADAAEMVNMAIKNRKGARIAYNMERKRELYHPDFRRDRDVLVEYIMEGYSRIGQAKYFSNKVLKGKKVIIPPGGENALAERFINSMPNRYMKSILNMGFNQVLNADISMLEPFLRPLRYFNAITLLSTSAVSQAGQVTHLIAEAGLMKTMKGMRDMLADMDLKEIARWQEWNGRIFTRSWRQDAKRALTMAMEPMKEPAFRSAATWPNIRQEVGRAAGKQSGFLWGLPTADMYLRVLADRTGRRMLEAMVKAGDVKGLKLLGKEVGRDLTGVVSSRGLLSSAEADTVGRYISNLTQFRTDPLHMPVAFNHELGKTVFQFFSFMRQHSRYVYRSLKELGNKNPAVRKRAAKRTARFLIMGAMVGEGISDVKAMLKGYGIEGEDYSERSTWEKFERTLYTKRISWKDPGFRILQNYSILGGIGIFQMMLENCIRPGADMTRTLGASADLLEKFAYRPITETLSGEPGKAVAGVTRETVARVPHFGYQLQREFLGTERQGIPAEGGWIGRAHDYWNPEHAELRGLTKTKEKGRREITTLRRGRKEEPEPELTTAGRAQTLRRQIQKQSKTKERERLLNLLQQARENKDFRSYKAILRRAKRQGFRIAEE